MSARRHALAASATPEFDALARALGVQRRYVDGTGRRRTASVEATLRVLRAMGCELTRPDDAGSELRRIAVEASASLCEPVLTRWSQEATPLRLGPAAAGVHADLRLVEEGGRVHEWTLAPAPPASGGRGPALFLPDDIPTGMHALSVTARGDRQHATLLVAPRRCWRPHTPPPTLATFLPLYAVRSREGLGVGNISHLERLVEHASTAGAGLFATLPLLSTLLDDPFEPSPYVPASRSVFGELFIDPHRAARDFPLPTLHALIESPVFKSESVRLRGADLVDYRASWRLLRQGLEAAAGDIRAAPALRQRVEAFGHDNSLLAAYARYRAQLAHQQRDDDQEGERWLYLCAQWLLDGQLRRLNAECPRRLYLDLPIGSHPQGFDAWRNPSLYAHGVSLGAPPDALFQGGQVWGFSPVIPAQSRRQGHREFATAVARHLDHAAALRIDHAAGLFRCFWVPAGVPASDGVYVHQPAHEHLGVLAILSHRARATVIGEDLGTVPRSITRGLQQRGLLGMSIAQFHLGQAPDPVPEPPGRTLVAMNTHDMPTFAAHWSGHDIDLHTRLGIIGPDAAAHERASREHMRARVCDRLRELGYACATTADVLRAILLRTAASEPDLLLVNLEDLWLEVRPQNVPGTSAEYPNWRRKAARALDDIIADVEIQSLIHELREAGKRAGRRAAPAAQRG